MAEAPKQEVKKKRSPKSGKRITVTLSDEHYDAVVKAALADDREPNVFLSRIVRQTLTELGANA